MVLLLPIVAAVSGCRCSPTPRPLDIPPVADTGGDFSINLVFPGEDDKLAVVAKGVGGALARVDIPAELWIVGSDEIADVIAELIDSRQLVMALMRG